MLTSLFASIAPFLVWPIELIFPYPHIVEELFKGLLVFFILKSPDNATRIRLGILAGFFFAFSESVLYISNILLVGTVWIFIERLFLTIPLHVLTTLLILFSGMKKKEFLVLGIVGAILAHYLFNLLVAGL